MQNCTTPEQKAQWHVKLRTMVGPEKLQEFQQSTQQQQVCIDAPAYSLVSSPNPYSASYFNCIK